MSVMNTFEFTVGERVRGEFGMGTIRHIHGKKATVEYGYGLKLQIKLCHLKHLEVELTRSRLTDEVHQQVHEVEGKKFPPLLNLYAPECEGVIPSHDLLQELQRQNDGCGCKQSPQNQSFTNFTHNQQISFDRERLRSAQRGAQSLFDEYSTSSDSTQKKVDGGYTPSHIVDLVLRVLGEIDLDPCADDGKHILAKSYYTETINGLEQEWFGRVFINPPYSCPDQWVAKLQKEYASGRVVEAIALLPAQTDSNWLNPVLKTQPVCFLQERITFLDENYQPNVPAPQPYCLVYWGKNQEQFKEVFEAYGVVYLPIPPSTQLGTYDQWSDKDLTAQISNSTQNRDDQEVLGENTSLLISPSTQVQNTQQVSEQSLLSTITPSIQVSSNDQVLRKNISLLNSPSTSVQSDSRIPESSLLTSIPSNPQVSNNNQVLGENISPLIPPSIYRKHGEGSGNLSWGYANANSTKKKPVKQLYFEWEYGGVRGRTYVRSHLCQRVIKLNEAKVPVTEILKLLSYNPKVARVLGSI